jgi:hypothetical protein
VSIYEKLSPTQGTENPVTHETVYVPHAREQLDPEEGKWFSQALRAVQKTFAENGLNLPGEATDLIAARMADLTMESVKEAVAAAKQPEPAPPEPKQP